MANLREAATMAEIRRKAYERGKAEGREEARRDRDLADCSAARAHGIAEGRQQLLDEYMDRLGFKLDDKGTGDWISAIEFALEDAEAEGRAAERAEVVARLDAAIVAAQEAPDRPMTFGKVSHAQAAACVGALTNLRLIFVENSTAGDILEERDEEIRRQERIRVLDDMTTWLAPGDYPGGEFGAALRERDRLKQAEALEEAAKDLPAFPYSTADISGTAIAAGVNRARRWLRDRAAALRGEKG